MIMFLATSAYPYSSDAEGVSFRYYDDADVGQVIGLLRIINKLLGHCGTL